MADFRKYTATENSRISVRAREVEDSEIVRVVGNSTAVANKGDFVVERPDTAHNGTVDIVPGDVFRDTYRTATGATPRPPVTTKEN